jgi:mono/diheme cytochrome c family protein
MRAHTRHLILALVILALLALLATVAARAQDFSGYSGDQLYMRFCASCHGESGQGDGVVAKSLSVMVPDLTRIARRQGGVFPEDQVRRIIDGRTTRPPHGSRDMPVWGYEFAANTTNGQGKSDAMVQRLTDYLRSLQK